MKKGIELSVNFIVVFVIALIILFFGIKLVYDIIGEGKEMEFALTKRVMDELEILAAQGERLSIAFNQETIPSGKQHIFGLGILNTDANKKYFAIKVEKGPAYDNDNNPIDEADNKIQVLFNNKAFIELDEHKKIPIMVKAPLGTKPGSYTLNVSVCHSDDEIDECTDPDKFYDKDNPVRKIYVEVP